MLGSGRKRLSEKQQHILNFLREFLEEHPYPPSVREIQGACAISSTSVVDYNLRLLERAGFIRRSPDIARGIELVGADRHARTPSRSLSIPVLGYVAAGAPLHVFPEAFEAEPMETLELPASLVPPGRKVFALRVKGKSMIDALIDDGDIVLVEPTHEAQDGEMVVAWLKDEKETTLKRLYRKGPRVRLEPANPSMQPIVVPAENVEVQGRFLGAIRLPR